MATPSRMSSVVMLLFSSLAASLSFAAMNASTSCCMTTPRVSKTVLWRTK